MAPTAAQFGGELATFDTRSLAGTPLNNNSDNNSDNNNNDNNNNLRQDVCERYNAVLAGNTTMRDALRGLQLRPLLRVGKYFHYDNVSGIDAADPGFMATLLDELARRAGFTWRNSFAVTYGPWETNQTFTDVLVWSVQHYDLSVNWWDQNLERLERGVTFLRPWFDGSLVLIEKQQPAEVDTDSIKFLNWLRPFTPQVWWVTIFTILTSALTYQWIEHLGGQRNNRNVWQWFSDNVYLSAINFPQNYEFQPQTTAGRIFGVSISIWALVMTATYTANLASLLVDTKESTVRVETMDDVLALGIPICTYANTGMDTYIKQRYRNAKRVPLQSELETFQALHQGRCALTVAYYQNWLGFAQNKTYNPTCSLAWVGRQLKTIQSGFAVSASHFCSSLIRDVLNIYIEELFSSGYLEELWEAEYDKTQDINCDEVRPEVLEQQQQQLLLQSDNGGARRRLLRQDESSSSSSLLTIQEELPQTSRDSSSSSSSTMSQPTPSSLSNRRRKLKAGGRGAAAVGGLADEGIDEEERLTLNQMAGTFILHYVLSFLAIVAGYLGRYFKEPPRLIQWTVQSVSKSFLRRTSGKRNITIQGDGGNGNLQDTETTTGITEKSASQKEEWREEASSRKNVSFHDETTNSDLIPTTTTNPTGEVWQQTQREVLETKQELEQTRQEMSQKMEMIISILSDLQHSREHTKQA